MNLQQGSCFTETKYRNKIDYKEYFSSILKHMENNSFVDVSILASKICLLLIFYDVCSIIFLIMHSRKNIFLRVFVCVCHFIVFLCRNMFNTQEVTDGTHA